MCHKPTYISLHVLLPQQITLIQNCWTASCDIVLMKGDKQYWKQLTLAIITTLQTETDTFSQIQKHHNSWLFYIYNNQFS